MTLADFDWPVFLLALVAGGAVLALLWRRVPEKHRGKVAVVVLGAAAALGLYFATRDQDEGPAVAPPMDPPEPDLDPSPDAQVLGDHVGAVTREEIAAIEGAADEGDYDGLVALGNAADARARERGR